MGNSMKALCFASAKKKPSITDFHFFLSEQVLKTISSPTIHSLVRNVILNLAEMQVSKCSKWFSSIHNTTVSNIIMYLIRGSKSAPIL